MKTAELRTGMILVLKTIFLFVRGMWRDPWRVYHLLSTGKRRMPALVDGTLEPAADEFDPEAPIVDVEALGGSEVVVIDTTRPITDLFDSIEFANGAHLQPETFPAPREWGTRAVSIELVKLTDVTLTEVRAALDEKQLQPAPWVDLLEYIDKRANACPDGRMFALGDSDETAEVISVAKGRHEEGPKQGRMFLNLFRSSRSFFVPRFKGTNYFAGVRVIIQSSS